MRQLTFLEPGRVEWWDVDSPTLQEPTDALVRPLVVATCDLDAAIVNGRAPLPGPFPLGHECVAEVVEAGPDAGPWRPGDLVSVPFQVSCGACDACRRGHTGFCERTGVYATFGLGEPGTRWGGFLSDRVRVPWAGHMLVALPPGVAADAAASASDNLPDAWRCVGPPLAERPGAEVLVCGGSGSIDLYAVALARAAGAGRIVYLAREPWRCDLARELGADEARAGAWPERLGPFAVTVDASGADAEALTCALRSTGPEGVCTSVGIFFEDAPVPLFEMFTNAVTFRHAYQHARPAIPAVLDLIAAGRLDPGGVRPDRVDWDDAAEAVAEHRSKLLIARPEGSQAAARRAESSGSAQ